MRLATVIEDGLPAVAVVVDSRCVLLDIPDAAMRSVRGIAGSGPAGLERISAWLEEQPQRAFRSMQGRGARHAPHEREHLVLRQPRLDRREEEEAQECPKWRDSTEEESHADQNWK